MQVLEMNDSIILTLLSIPNKKSKITASNALGLKGAPVKLFVCIKQVPDTETKIQLKADKSGIEENGVKWVMNPYDEFAVEEALKVKEANAGSTVTVVTVGPKSRAVDALRTALAMGA